MYQREGERGRKELERKVTAVGSGEREEGRGKEREKNLTSMLPVVLLFKRTSSRVVFPDPDGPMMATNSPGLMYMFTWLRMVFLCER